VIAKALFASPAVIQRSKYAATCTMAPNLT
jgi:hypothetical protein